MKMTVLLAPLLALCLSGCWTDPGTLAASTIPITNDDSYTVLAKEVTGTDYGFLLLTFPLWTASTYDAIQDAKEFSGADGLINVTAENQTRVEERLPILLDLPARHKGVMIAPFIGQVDLEPFLATGQLETVFADGENYDGQRPLHYEWVKKLHDQCVQYGVPFSFFSTGNVFVKEGRTYHICKAYQHVQALRPGLQYPPVAPPPIQKRCATCKRNQSCGGCHWCGKCGS